MDINSCYAWITDTERNNNTLFTSSIRGLIIGKSNCGKTTLLLNLLLKPGWLDYDHLYVFGKSLHQKEYQVLKTAFKYGLSKNQTTSIFENQTHFREVNVLEAIASSSVNNKNKIHAEFFDDCTAIPDPSELNPEDNNLMVMDDCVLGSQNKAEAYYTRGRHNNCDSLYLSQSYFQLPRKSIRENSNFIILFPQDSKNISHIYQDHCTDISLAEFKSFCMKAWTQKHNFVTIDLTSSKFNGKYRMNFNMFYIPDSV